MYPPMSSAIQEPKINRKVSFTDSSKQRSKLRSKNMGEKKRQEGLVEQHNFFNQMLEEIATDITSHLALTGCFPWIDPEW